MQVWRHRRGGGRGERHLVAYGLRRVCAAWGMARSSFYASSATRRAAAGKASASPRDHAGGDRSDLEASPWEGEGYRKVWARFGFATSAQASAGTICSRPIAAAVAAIPMTVRSSLMPRTCVAFGCSRWTTAGAGSSPPSSIGTPSVSAGMSASAATARADLHELSNGSQYPSPTGSSSGASRSPKARSIYRNIAELRDFRRTRPASKRTAT